MKNPSIVHHVIVLFFTCFFAHYGQAQTATHIEEDFDFLTAEWLDVSGQLKTYNGLELFCTSPDFRSKATDILGLLHYYDSLVLDIMLDPTYELEISHREYKHTIKDIQQFEKNYSITKFMAFLRKSCGTRNELERNKEDLVKASGVYSYDGKILVLETELRSFLRNIDKKVIAIDDHLHMIHPDHIKLYQSVSENKH